MKKLLTLTLLLAILPTFSACGGDDKEDNVLNSEPEAPSNPYIGTWEYSIGNYSHMQKGYFEIAEDYSIKNDYFIYQDNQLYNVNTLHYTYRIEYNSYGEEILYIDLGRGSHLWCEGLLLRDKLVVYEIKRDSQTGEESRTLWTEMTRYAPRQ